MCKSFIERLKFRVIWYILMLVIGIFVNKNCVSWFRIFIVKSNFIIIDLMFDLVWLFCFYIWWIRVFYFEVGFVMF